MIRKDKKNTRNAIRQACLSLSAEEKKRQEEAICRQLWTLPQVKQATILLAYIGINHEIDTLPFLRAWLSCGKHLLLPKVEDDHRLTLYHIRNLDADLRPGFRSILEPIDERCVVWKEAIDIILVPGMAFTRSGRRLGQGKGYYDRLLPLYPDALKLAGALTPQLLETLPIEEHDQPIDIVVTPHEIIYCQ